SDLLFWGSLAIALAVAFAAAYPVNRALIARGRGHAVVHAYPVHGGRLAREGEARAELGEPVLDGAVGLLGRLAGEDEDEGGHAAPVEVVRYGSPRASPCSTRRATIAGLAEVSGSPSATAPSSLAWRTTASRSAVTWPRATKSDARATSAQAITPSRPRPGSLPASSASRDLPRSSSARARALGCRSPASRRASVASCSSDAATLPAS